ncbi:MAG: tetratricopeptide repeat protein [Planctomycetota bacterium]|nr:tetratricopeptide repeat protein [Planctomycetota bacterium]
MKSDPGKATIRFAWTITSVLILVYPCSNLQAQPSVKERLEAARILRQSGKSPESIEIYDDLKQQKPIQADPKVLGEVWQGLALAQSDIGGRSVTQPELEKIAGQLPKNAELPAILAQWAFDSGQWEKAKSLIDTSLKIDPNNFNARWLMVKLLDAQGSKDEATKSAEWFIKKRNENPENLDANQLVTTGQAAERFYRATTRGEQLSESLSDILTELYDSAITRDAYCWQAHWAAGKLFLAGYNEKRAIPELQKALRINPLAAEVILTLGRADLDGYKLAAGRQRAQRAFEINPEYAPAQILLADLNISDERFDDALKAAQIAVKLTPKDEDALARLAAARQLVADELGLLEAEQVALAQNPTPATFYYALGERLADRRKYHAAERAFLQAVAADPRRADSKVGLGMLYMQIGRETEAHVLFDDAFEADPFNVRADNMLKVLAHMATYKEIATDHFRVIYDPSQDEVLAQAMSDYLEKIYPKMVLDLGFEPAGQTQIEIMKNHQWFSGRTTGLPFLPTVGACTGRVVALASPQSTQQPYNWARVLTHELVHVITLQQTNFNIPHWFTEALAVQSEGFPRPQPWNVMLLERVPKRQGVLNLDTINLGFIRPKEPEDRQMAYCQAQLYAEFMTKRFGPDSLRKMLTSYAQGVATQKAVETNFGVSKALFEKEYLAYLDEVVGKIKARSSTDEKLPTQSELERTLAKDPKNADAWAALAYDFFARRDLKAARSPADKALELKPGQPLASYVKARLLTSIDDEPAALALLKKALDEKAPNPRVLDLLAELEMNAGQLDAALKLYQLARKDDPYNPKWIAGLTRIHLRQKNIPEMLNSLALLASADSDDLDVRIALAERSLALGDSKQARKWAEDCLVIDTYNIRAYDVLAKTLIKLELWQDARKTCLTMLKLESVNESDVRKMLADIEAKLKPKN